ncbi:MAG: penicillin-binding protein [Actinomycetota bacterium]|nr:penicillin-binding protein [Actinomycetota bacterium]
MPHDGTSTGWYQRLLRRDGRWFVRWAPLLFVPVVAVAATALAGASVFLHAYLTMDLPAPEDLTIPDPTVVYASNGQRVATLDPTAIRRNVDVEQLPDHVWQAVLAAEDRGFFSHPGFAWSALLRAAWVNVRHGEIEQGGSTITMQYVELAIRDVPRTMVGKIREIAAAVKLERRLPKEEVLEHYLNAAPFGRGAIGIEAAAKTYFGVSASQLSVNQAATLAGMIAAPSRYDPERDPGAANQRRIYVLNGMAEQGWISDEMRSRLVAAGVPAVSREPLVQYGPHSYYVDAVRDVLADELGDRRDVDIGLRVFTEMNPGLQRVALDTLNAHLEGTAYTGAIVTIDPRNGAVRALIGGLGFPEEQFNHATRGGNQAGSAFKPFALAAFVAAGYSPTRSVFAAPATMTVDFDRYPDYRVSNFGRRGFGAQSVYEATLTSTNVVYAQLTSEVGPAAVAEVATSLGIADDEDLRRATAPAIALGTADVTPLNMARAYSGFANGGSRVAPQLIRRVETTDGDVLLDASPQLTRVLQPNVAHVVTDVLHANIRRGTGAAAQIGRPAAGKTGTTDDFRDAWFVGYVPQLATAVWIGTPDNTPMDGVTGSSIPAETWGDYMGDAVANLPVADFPDPDLAVLSPVAPQTVTNRAAVAR